MGIPLDKAEFLALFLETFIYGVFFTLCTITLIVLVRFRQSDNRRDGYLRLIAGIMLVLATSHLILDFVRAVHAFVIDRDELAPIGPAAYYESLNAPLFLAKTVLYWTQTMVGDGVIVWRCYVVYGRRILFVAFPIILMLGVFVSGVQVVNSLAHATLGSDIFTTAENWITVYFVLTMTINLYCSGASHGARLQPMAY
ncbi:hypothetical protein EWM64_g10486 [Hericium alpestre]|uniref:Uncharacterized protein n=1 Tax=Hericium alpestre TaxID=135208 RepID=A0A4Y9ZFI0_9AGAM|nr:hypothetical protein EWM64_g10486 [Hericium alpestre]